MAPRPTPPSAVRRRLVGAFGGWSSTRTRAGNQTCARVATRFPDKTGGAAPPAPHRYARTSSSARNHGAAASRQSAAHRGRRADIPVCRFGRLSSRQSRGGIGRQFAGLESPGNRQTRMSAPQHAAVERSPAFSIAGQFPGNSHLRISDTSWGHEPCGPGRQDAGPTLRLMDRRSGGASAKFPLAAARLNLLSARAGS